MIIPAKDLQDRFRAGRYLERADAGEFGCCIRKDSTPLDSHQGTGSRSVSVSYVDDDGFRVFLVHLYMVRETTGEWRVGASGLPDPKWLYEGGIIYRPKSPLVA